MTAEAGWTTPAVTVDQDLVDTLVRRGGYTHPLFNPDASAQAGGARAPLMGQGVLLLAGGLVEQSGQLDHAVAMLGLEDVRFSAMVHAGATLRVRGRELSVEPTGSGTKAVTRYRWTVLDQDDRTVLTATAVMLTRVAASPPGSATPDTGATTSTDENHVKGTRP